MNTVELDRSQVEFFFENCECIIVDMWAIKYFHFDVKEERWAWDPDHKNFLNTKYCDNVSIQLDISDPKFFSHVSRLVDKGKTVEQDGLECIERLKTSDDLCGFKINSIDYLVPWDNETVNTSIGIPVNTNKAQENVASINKQGVQTLSIKIKAQEKLNETI